MSKTEKTAVIISDYGMGSGDEALRITLVTNYLNLLVSENKLPDYICCYGNGVKLACTNSPVINELKAIEQAGCHIILCKTCLVYNHLLESVEVGTIGTMLDILGVHEVCAKLIKL